MENSIKLYVSLEDIDKLIKGELLSEESAIVESFVSINVHAIKNTMYPLNGPLNPFKHCSFQQIDCIIVGGMPISIDTGKLSRWTGSSYCVRDNIDGSDLHSAICYNQNGTDAKFRDLDPVLSRLQKDGIVLMPEALSNFEGGVRLMAKLWEPFIWNYLFRFSNKRPEVPIIFTTETAIAKFESAVMAADHRFALIVSNHQQSGSSDVLACVEKLIADSGQSYFNFYTKSLK